MKFSNSARCLALVGVDDCGCLDDAGTTFTGLITHYQTTALSNPVPAFSFWLPFSRFGTHMDNIYWRFIASYQRDKSV